MNLASAASETRSRSLRHILAETAVHLHPMVPQTMCARGPPALTHSATFVPKTTYICRAHVDIIPHIPCSHISSYLSSSVKKHGSPLWNSPRSFHRLHGF